VAIRKTSVDSIIEEDILGIGECWLLVSPARQDKDFNHVQARMALKWQDTRTKDNSELLVDGTLRFPAGGEILYGERLTALNISDPVG
jgi:hypothetical protein